MIQHVHSCSNLYAFAGFPKIAQEYWEIISTAILFLFSRLIFVYCAERMQGGGVGEEGGGGGVGSAPPSELQDEVMPPSRRLISQAHCILTTTHSYTMEKKLLAGLNNTLKCVRNYIRLFGVTNFNHKPTSAKIWLKREDNSKKLSIGWDGQKKILEFLHILIFFSVAFTKQFFHIGEFYVAILKYALGKSLLLRS